MAEQEFLASFGIEIDESGLQRLQAALERNRELAEELAAAFGRARESVQAFFADLSEMSFSGPDFNPPARVTEAQQGFSLPLSIDFTRAGKELAAFFKEAGKSFRLNADASGVVSAGRRALSELQSLYASTVLTLQVELSGPSLPEEGLEGAATGGRFDSPATVEIAEDGDPEYVIPVKKESLAVPLLRQLIGELSESARETLRQGFPGGDGSDALSGLPDLLASAGAASAQVVNRYASCNVSAPVSIQVTASAADPEAVGRSIYDVTEQYLLRTLRSAASP